MSGIPWLKLALAGAFTFLLAMILVGGFALILRDVELPKGAPWRDAVLYVVGIVGAAVSLGTVAFLVVTAFARWLGV